MALTDKTFFENMQAKGISKLLSHLNEGLDEAIAKTIKWVRRLDNPKRLAQMVSCSR